MAIFFSLSVHGLYDKVKKKNKTKTKESLMKLDYIMFDDKAFSEIIKKIQKGICKIREIG